MVTTQDQRRLLALEEEVAALKLRLNGAASKNQFNKLRILAGQEVTKLKELVEELETELDELLELARKLQ